MMRLDQAEVQRRYEERCKTDRIIQKLKRDVTDRERLKQERIAELQEQIKVHRKKHVRSERLWKAASRAMKNQTKSITTKKATVNRLSHKTEREIGIVTRKKQLKKVVSAEIAVEVMKQLRRDLRTP